MGASDVTNEKVQLPMSSTFEADLLHRSHFMHDVLVWLQTGRLLQAMSQKPGAINQEPDAIRQEPVARAKRHDRTFVLSHEPEARSSQP